MPRRLFLSVVLSLILLPINVAFADFSGRVVGISDGDTIKGLDVKLVFFISPVSPGSEATITINTAPNANCQISVYYKARTSKALLFPKSADDQGRVSWTWRIGPYTTPGTWPIGVTCTAQGQKGTLEASLIVQ